MKVLYKEWPVFHSFMTMKYRLNRWILHWQLPNSTLCDLLTVKYLSLSVELKSLLKDVRKTEMFLLDQSCKQNCLIFHKSLPPPQKKVVKRGIDAHNS